MTRRVAAVVSCLLAAGAIATSAQGLSGVPSLGTSVVSDDNLFHRPTGEGDVIVRFSPRLDSLYETERLALSSRYTLDAERFARHPELTTAHARQEASFSAGYSASRRLSITAAAAFTETQTPADLNDVTALTPGRARARRLTVHPSVTYDLGPRAVAGIAYAVTSERLRGGVSLTTQSAISTLDHRLSARDGLRVEYLDQHFLFGGVQATASRAVAAEWTREVTAGTSLTLRAGPRLTSGTLAPEIAASVRRQLRAGNLAVSYRQTQTTLIGLSGLAGARSVTATAERALRPGVRLRAGSTVLQTRQGTLSSRVYRASASCAWTPAGRLGIEAGYDTDLQHGNLYTGQTAIIRRRVATLKLLVMPTSGSRDR